MQRALQRFESGAEIDFGAIKVSRSEGVIIRKWFMEKRIQWQEIAGYDSVDSHFSFHRFDKRFTWSVSSELIANAHVLRALLDGVMQKVWQR